MNASALDRFNDLQRQGFMKLGRKVKAAKPLLPIVACDACLNWHRKGKHTATLAQRRENLAKA